MEKDFTIRLYDILEMMQGARDAIADVTLADYLNSDLHWKTQRIVERCLQIISEASRSISPEAKTHFPHVPWTEIAAIGNVLRHEYGRLDQSLLYLIVRDRFDTLETAVKTMLQERT